MTKKSAIVNDLLFRIKDNDVVEVMRKLDNVKDSLREIAEENNFEVDPKWNTRSFGAKIIKEFGEGNSARVGNYLINKLENNSIEAFELVDGTEEIVRSIANSLGVGSDSLSVVQLAEKVIDLNTVVVKPAKTGKTTKYSLTVKCSPWEIQLWNCNGQKDLSNTDGFNCIEWHHLQPISDSSNVDGTENPDWLDWSGVQVFVTKEGGKEVELDEEDFSIGKLLEGAFDQTKIQTPATILWKIVEEDGSFFNFELEVDGEFDPKKLKFIQKNYFDDTTSFPGDVSFILPDTIIYDGKEYKSEDGETNMNKQVVKMFSSEDNYSIPLLDNEDDEKWDFDYDMAVDELFPE